MALNVPALAAAEEQSVRAAYLVMPVVADYALLPLAIATVVTGIALALGTRWGLLQRYWVTMSLAMTLFAATVLFSICRRWTTTQPAPQIQNGTSRLWVAICSIRSADWWC